MHNRQAMSPDYVHEDTTKLERDLNERKNKISLAQKEIEHARSLRLDLQGPIRAAQGEVEWNSEIVKCLERIMTCVKAGYSYFERQGFEDAVDACGEILTWQMLSEVPAPGTIYGEDKFDIRIPVEAQTSYARAVAMRLFDKFVICRCFEPPEDRQELPEGIGAYYLFGEINFPNAEGKYNGLFLVHQW